MRERAGIMATLLGLGLTGLVMAQPPGPVPTPIFLNGFETSTACAWSVHPGVCVATVEDVQKGVVAGDVALENVIVTERDANAKNLWVADAATAAAMHGVYVFRGGGASTLTVAVGDAVDVTGTVTEFDASPPGDTLTEIVATAEVSFVGAGGAPVALLVPTGVLSSLVSGEAYEGVLVKVYNVCVSSTAAGDLVTLGNSDGLLVMDDVAYDYSAASYPVGACFEYVTGVMHLDTIANERRILPRSSTDLVPGAG